MDKPIDMAADGGRQRGETEKCDISQGISLCIFDHDVNFFKN